MSVIKEDDVTDRRIGWAWLDGSEGTWLTWKDNEPHINEKCARIRKINGVIMLLGKGCETLYYFICKQVRIVG